MAPLLAAKDPTPEAILASRESLLKTFSLRHPRIQDTFQKTSGTKDVVLCETEDGRSVVLRIGERRPDWFFSNGYDGERLRIPRVFHAGGADIPFEIEECVSGKMLFELERASSREGKISEKTFSLLLDVYLEFFRISEELPKEQPPNMGKILDHFEKSAGLIPEAAEGLIRKHEAFWETGYPAKWKFATDNLILDPSGKVVFIDNFAVGKRYFGYDFGWLIWPRWGEMENEPPTDIDSHLAYLDRLKDLFVQKMSALQLSFVNVEQAFDHMLFERLVGSLFDVARQVRHFSGWGMAGEEGRERREQHKIFLQALLDIVMKRL